LPVLAWRVHDVGCHFQLQLHAALVGLTLVLVLTLRRLTLALKSALLVSFLLLLGLVGVFTAHGRHRLLVVPAGGGVGGHAVFDPRASCWRCCLRRYRWWPGRASSAAPSTCPST